MIHLKQPVIVEGKYDRIRLEAVTDALIITTNGFGIYRDKEKMALIRAFAEKDGIIILTDSDAAGFQIRSHIKSCIKKGKIYNIYIPDIFGKERRKEKMSKEGKLGVEGMSSDVLEQAFRDAGIFYSHDSPKEWLSRTRLLSDGLIGGQGSALLRKKLLYELKLPEHLSTSGLLEVLNRLYTMEQYENVLKKVKE